MPSAGQKIPVQPGWWYLPPEKIQVAENRFLQAGKGAENTKEKIQAVLYVMYIRRTSVGFSLGSLIFKNCVLLQSLTSSGFVLLMLVLNY